MCVPALWYIFYDQQYSTSNRDLLICFLGHGLTPQFQTEVNLHLKCIRNILVPSTGNLAIKHLNKF